MKIAMLLSGGVDSSVALALLKASGEHEIVAFYLKIWLEDDFAFLGECPWEDDLGYARAVCEMLDVPLRVVSLQQAYWDRVVAHTVGELKAGRTPSPDILCNQRVKFGAFTDHIDSSFDRIATGHYVRLREKPGYPAELLKGIDPIKDQSYFLSHLSQDQLSRSLFPLGGYNKSEVRKLAEQFNLPNKNRRDSQGICFLGKIKYNDFVKCHLGEKPGPIIDRSTGKTLGRHAGYWFHTVGQRKGLGLSHGPWFVASKDIERNIVYVEKASQREESQRLDFTVSGLNWLGAPPESPGEAAIKIRHGATTVASRFSGDPLQRLMVNMSEENGGTAPGQYAVFYDGEVCLGGGVIDG